MELWIGSRFFEAMAAMALAFGAAAGGIMLYRMGWKRSILLVLWLTVGIMLVMGAVYGYTSWAGYENPLLMAGAVGPTDPLLEVIMSFLKLPGQFALLGGQMGLESMLNDPEGLLVVEAAHHGPVGLVIKNTMGAAGLLAIGLILLWLAMRNGNVITELILQFLINLGFVVAMYGEPSSLIGVLVFGGVAAGLVRVVFGFVSHSHVGETVEQYYGAIFVVAMIVPVFADQLPKVQFTFWNVLDAVIIFSMTLVLRKPLAMLERKFTNLLGEQMTVIGAGSRIAVINIIARASFEHGDMRVFSVLTLISAISIVIGLPWTYVLAQTIKKLHS